MTTHAFDLRLRLVNGALLPVVGVLVLVAGVLLLIGRGYPRNVFDLVMGFNR